MYLRGAGEMPSLGQIVLFHAVFRKNGQNNRFAFELVNLQEIVVKLSQISSNSVQYSIMAAPSSSLGGVKGD